ncbi:M1 family metallopeptidase, partial [candidate division WOR-3 bacterium]|nr:M1 family metallopeptidase [candidate division WOR-3 bacterium]
MIIILFLLHAAWQQRVSYEIRAVLDTDEHTLAASADLTYYNNSPFALDTIYLYLHANAFGSRQTYYVREAGKMGDQRFERMPIQGHGGMTVDRVASNAHALGFCITETILAVPLAQPVIPGDSVNFTIDYWLRIPRELHEFGYWPGHYEMTCWYPRVCVFDAAGWHVEALHPLGGTYGEFGRYDVTIDLPADYVVAATGRQVVHAGREFASDLNDRDNENVSGGRKRVRFAADDVDDFIWVCDREFGVRMCKVENTNISVFYRRENENHGENACQYAIDAVSRLARWFGDYPYGDICIVDGFHRGGAAYPQMIIISMKEDRLTRYFEAQLAGEIGKQWFDAVIGVNGSRDGWLGQGLAAYAAIRYMEDKYGPEYSLMKTPLLPPLSLEYCHRLYYYVMQTNRLEKPVSASAGNYVDLPIVYESSIRSKPALFFRSLENMCGRDQFDGMLRQYYQEHTFKHARPEDLIGICSRFSDHDLAPLFDSFIHTTEFCDWAVKRVTGHTVEIENRGDLRMPVDVLVRTASGEHNFALDGKAKDYLIELPHDAGEVTGVAIDPSENTLDPDLWNNHFPRRVSVKPVFDFDWPSFSTYQIIWSPYLWYNHYDGVKAGLYVFGDKFADFDFVKGGYQKTAGYVRGFGSGRDYPLLNYQTPVVFRDGLRVRLRFSGSRSRGGDYISLGFASSLGRPFARKPQVEITNMLVYGGLFTYAGLDSIDWDLGKNVSLDNHFRFRYSALNIDARLAFAHHALGSDWQYLKSTFEIRRSFAIGVPFTVRLFVGKIFGAAPVHEQLFLS